MSVGTRLEKIIESSVAVKLLTAKSGGCGCTDFKAKMNKWGVAGCRANRAMIVDHLCAQAEKYARVPLLAKLMGGTIREHAELWVDQAIREAHEHRQPSLVWYDTADHNAVWYSAQSVGKYVLGAGEFFQIGNAAGFPGASMQDFDSVLESDDITDPFVYMPTLIVSRHTTLEWLTVPRVDSSGELAELPLMVEKDKAATAIGNGGEFRAAYCDLWCDEPERTAEYALTYAGVFV